MERTTAIQQTMIDLDVNIWGKYHPEETDFTKPNLNQAGIWLKNDIESILTIEGIDVAKTVEDISAMIKATPYGNEILDTFVPMREIIEAAEIRNDFKSAFSKVKRGYELSHKVGYGLSKVDIKRLATLHKSNKCRRKIEELLTDCNFHYECGEFINKRYAEFMVA